MLQVVRAALLHLAVACSCWAPAPSEGQACQSDNCWLAAGSLHASLNTAADPCQDFEEFACGGFRAGHQLTGPGLLLPGGTYTDYMRNLGRAFSQRVTEQLATDCWTGDRTGDRCRGAAAPAARLRAYEALAAATGQDCARLEANGTSLHDLMRASLPEVLEEAVDLGLEGVDEPGSGRLLRFESLLPAQTHKALLSPMNAVPGFATRLGRPALLLLGTREPFSGLGVASGLLSHFPLQAGRLMRRLRLPAGVSRRGNAVLLSGLLRLSQASARLWGLVCHSAVARVLNDSGPGPSPPPMRTVADAKRLLRLANVSENFNLDEFLRLSVAPWNLTVTDATDVLSPDPVAFLECACLMGRMVRYRPEMPKVMVLHQVAMLTLQTVTIPASATCLGEFFGEPADAIGGGGKSGGSDEDDDKGEDDSRSRGRAISPLPGVFRPLLHGRYARSRAAAAAGSAEADANELFARLKAAYAEALNSSTAAWIPVEGKAILTRRLAQIGLTFHRDALTDAQLVRAYRVTLDRMPSRGCSLAGASPACLLVRLRALRMSLGLVSAYHDLDAESPHYALLRDAVHLTPAFAEPPHFRTGLPLAARLGLVGSALAHELAHGLTAEFDSAEHLRRTDRRATWTHQVPSGWPADFADAFVARLGCLRRRLVAELGGLNKTSVEEDFADRVGLSVALRALGNDTGRLPGYMSRFTPQQLFYITSLRTFCTKSASGFLDAYRAVRPVETHTLGRQRFLSMLTGDLGFARAFGCPVRNESAEERCTFW